MDRRPEDVRRVENDEVPGEPRLVLPDELPGGLLREGLAREVLVDVGGVAALGLDLADGLLVPVLLGVEPFVVGVDGEDGGARGGDDDALDGVVRVLERALQDGERAADGGVEQLARVVGVEVEGRRGVLDSIDSLDCFVEGTLL